MLQSFFFQHSSKESIISRRFSIELYKSFHMTSKYLHASFLFLFYYYCNNYFLSALLRWRRLQRHRYHFRRKFSYYSHNISDLATHFWRHMINTLSTFSRQHSFFNNNSHYDGSFLKMMSCLK